MPDPICHMTQGGLMLVAPFLRTIRRKSTLILVAFAGAILGDLPDLIGVSGIIFAHDNGRLYRLAHAGAIKDVLQYIPMYWLHLFLDSFTHSMEDRWSLWNEWVLFEVVVWTVNVLLIILMVRIRRHGIAAIRPGGLIYYWLNERLDRKSIRDYRNDMNRPE
jgi:hypothetical protein